MQKKNGRSGGTIPKDLEQSIQNSLRGSATAIDGVFLIIQEGRLLMCRHPDAPPHQRTMPQFDVGIVSWRGMDAFMQSARTAFRHHVDIVGEPELVPVMTYGHQGIRCKKLLVYLGVRVPSFVRMNLRETTSCTSPEWLAISNTAALERAFASLRDSQKAREHMKAVALWRTEHAVAAPGSVAA